MPKRWNWRRNLHFSLPKMCSLVSPLWNGAEFTLSVAKALHSSKQFAFFVKFALFAIVLPLSNGVTGDRSTEKKTIEFLAAPSFSSKKWIKLIPKTIGNRKKRLCARLRSGDKHPLRKSADRKAQIRKAFVPLTGLICAFRSADFLRGCLSPERNLTHNLFFLFPIVFGIIHTFRSDLSEKDWRS